MKSKIANLKIRWSKKNSKWGINILDIDPFLVNYIKSQEQFKWLDADTQGDTIKILLHMEESKLVNSPRYYISPYSNRVMNLRSVKKESKYIDWYCPICHVDTEVMIGKFDSKSIVCKSCYKEHIAGNKITPEIVLRSALKLRLKIKELLEDNQKRMIKWIRKS